LIPPFGPDGLLPVGAHQTDAQEIERRLVQVHPLSATRAWLYDAWRRRRAAMASLVAIEREWVNGSFVTLKRDPGDVDVVSFVRGEAIENLTEDAVTDLRNLFERERIRRIFGCDGYLVIIRPIGHPQRAAYEERCTYWHDWWSRTRDDQPKGYLDVVGEP
jgi:hypothetical protein